MIDKENSHIHFSSLVTLLVQMQKLLDECFVHLALLITKSLVSELSKSVF